MIINDGKAFRRVLESSTEIATRSMKFEANDDHGDFMCKPEAKV